MIYDNQEIIDCIKEFVDIKKKEGKLVEGPLKEDVFNVLSRECILLYYPSMDDEIKGCHVEKYLCNELKQFVFINTRKSSNEQTWTAAHELGHVWKVDGYVEKKIKTGIVTNEDIVNRFASEVLFPEMDFERELKAALDESGVTENRLSRNQFMKVITYLMNVFAAPYKAVIRRLVELKKVSRDNESKYISLFAQNLDYYKELKETGYYPRLIGSEHKSYSMENVGADIDELESLGCISEAVAQRYRDMFHTRKECDTEATYLIGDEDGDK